jgi:hypothetical protein
MNILSNGKILTQQLSHKAAPNTIKDFPMPMLTHPISRSDHLYIYIIYDIYIYDMYIVYDMYICIYDIYIWYVWCVYIYRYDIYIYIQDICCVCIYIYTGIYIHTIYIYDVYIYMVYIYILCLCYELLWMKDDRIRRLRFHNQVIEPRIMAQLGATAI